MSGFDPSGKSYGRKKRPGLIRSALAAFVLFNVAAAGLFALSVPKQSAAVDEAAPSAAPAAQALATDPTVRAQNARAIEQVLADAGDCLPALQDIAKQLVVFFPPNETFAAPNDVAAVQAFAGAIARCPNVRVVVEGHTVDTGDEAQNSILSYARAENIVRALKSGGAPESALHPLGYGARYPYAEGDADAEDQGLNRRVQFRVMLSAE